MTNTLYHRFPRSQIRSYRPIGSLYTAAQGSFARKMALVVSAHQMRLAFWCYTMRPTVRETREGY